MKLPDWIELPLIMGLSVLFVAGAVVLVLAFAQALGIK